MGVDRVLHRSRADGDSIEYSDADPNAGASYKHADSSHQHTNSHSGLFVYDAYRFHNRRTGRVVDSDKRHRDDGHNHSN